MKKHIRIVQTFAVASCAVVLSGLTGCGGAPTAMTQGGTTDDAEFSELPDTNPLDGFWIANTILESNQILVGPYSVWIESRARRPACVTQGRLVRCPNLDWGQPSSSRPITLDKGLIQIEFSMDFPPCKYDHLSDLFEGETLISLTIIGLEIPGTNGLEFDVAIEQRFVFSDVTVVSTGTLRHFVADMESFCE